jgi:hypothetical protein
VCACVCVECVWVCVCVTRVWYVKVCFVFPFLESESCLSLILPWLFFVSLFALSAAFFSTLSSIFWPWVITPCRGYYHGKEEEERGGGGAGGRTLIEIEYMYGR